MDSYEETVDNHLKNAKLQFDNLKKIKNDFDNNPLELIKFIRGGGDLENYSLTTRFKRFTFAKSEAFNIGKQDFYSNVVIYTEIPKTLTTLCLMVIHNLMKTHDRYEVIIALQRIFILSKDIDLILKRMEDFYNGNS